MTSQYDMRANDKRYVALRPSYAGRILGWMAVASILLCWYGYAFAQFLPSTLGLGIGITSGAVIGATGAFFELRWKPVTDRPMTWKTNPLVKAPLLALVGFVMGYAAFGIGLPSLYSGIFGVPATRQAAVTGWNISRYHCDGPQLGGNFLFYGNPCVAGHALPRGTILTLRGHQSALGFAITGVAVSRGF